MLTALTVGPIWTISWNQEFIIRCLELTPKSALLSLTTVFPHIGSAETIFFLIWKFKGHST